MTAPSDSSGNGERANAPSIPDGADSSRQSPGQLLRQARERQDFTIEEVATRSRLSKSILEALERDDFLYLGEPVYARGYYRKYAAILNVPEEPLINAYQQLAGPKRASTPQKPLLLPDDLGPSLHRRHRRTRRGGRWWWFALISLIVFAGLIWHLSSRMRSVPATLKIGLAESSAHSPQKAPANPHQGISLPASSISVMATPSTVSAPAKSLKNRVAGAESTTSSTSSRDPVNSIRSSSGPSKSTNTVNADGGGTGSADALTLFFHQTSWVRIEDSTGKILLSGLIEAGKRETLVGKPPYSVFLGNAPGVNINYNGQNVDLKTYTKPNSTARFAVPKP